MIDHDPVVQAWIAAGTPLGPVSYQTKAYILKCCAQLFDLRVLIETGTLEGENLRLLATEFDEMHSIELSEAYRDLAAKRLAGHNHIYLHLGDSKDVLARLRPLIDRAVLIYLDAHFMGGDTALGPDYSPALSELEAVRWGDVVVIDDVEEFRTNPAYPSEQDLLEQIGTILKGYTVFEVGNEYVLMPKQVELPFYYRILL